MRIVIDTIPHAEQRYKTSGDWYYGEDGTLHIKVSALPERAGGWKAEACVAIHELVEALLCKAHGITAEEVDGFDLRHNGSGEPGDDFDAPYRREHRAATVPEFFLLDALDLERERYDAAFEEL